jgi:hypothetical protein
MMIDFIARILPIDGPPVRRCSMAVDKGAEFAAQNTALVTNESS